MTATVASLNADAIDLMRRGRYGCALKQFAVATLHLKALIDRTSSSSAAGSNREEDEEAASDNARNTLIIRAIEVRRSESQLQVQQQQQQQQHKYQQQQHLLDYSNVQGADGCSGGGCVYEGGFETYRKALRISEFQGSASPRRFVEENLHRVSATLFYNMALTHHLRAHDGGLVATKPQQPQAQRVPEASPCTSRSAYFLQEALRFYRLSMDLLEPFLYASTDVPRDDIYLYLRACNNTASAYYALFEFPKALYCVGRMKDLISYHNGSLFRSPRSNNDEDNNGEYYDDCHELLRHSHLTFTLYIDNELLPLAPAA